MFRINKILAIPDNPFRREAIDLKILELVEKICPFKPVSFVEKKELTKANGKRRFLIVAAHGMRDK